VLYASPVGLALHAAFEEPAMHCDMFGAGKARGYAFIEYQDKKDMKEAYKTADGRKIEGRRVLVDVERGRTVESW
jgi:U1 small nuclear ribonucleoprotein 70kDa